MASLLRLILSVLQSTRDSSRGGDLSMQYCYIVFRTTLLRILSSIRIIFFSATTHAMSATVRDMTLIGSLRAEIVTILVAFMESLLITAEQGACGTAGCADALPRRFADSEWCGPAGEGSKALMIRITLYGARSTQVQ